MKKADFINGFNTYNLDKVNRKGAKYIAILDDSGRVAIRDCNDAGFFAQVAINGDRIKIDVSYSGESNEFSHNVKKGLPDDIFGYVVDQLDVLSRTLKVPNVCMAFF